MIDKTSFFIPSGYDRFSVLKSSDTQHDLDYDYYDIIKNEERVKENNQKEQEIECEKEKRPFQIEDIQPNQAGSKIYFVRVQAKPGLNILQ